MRGLQGSSRVDPHAHGERDRQRLSSLEDPLQTGAVVEAHDEEVTSLGVHRRVGGHRPGIP
jgi:hypothetical protein